MSIYNNIRATLDSHLASLPGVPPIAPQNVLYEPTNGVTFLKTTLVPTLRRPAVRGLNPQLRYDGLYSILVCTPQGNGSGAGYDLADTILDWFAPTTDLIGSATLSIDYSEVGTSYLDPPFYCTPITVAWYCYN